VALSLTDEKGKSVSQFKLNFSTQTNIQNHSDFMFKATALTWWNLQSGIWGFKSPTNIGIGAQSTLGGGGNIFLAEKMSENAQILHDSCPKISMYPNIHDICPKN